MKNPKVGERVKDKNGLGDEGEIIAVDPSGVIVKWFIQDISEIAEGINPATLRRVKPAKDLLLCPTCGRVR